MFNKKTRKTMKSIDKMSKDELLDYTANVGIKADYRMTVKRLRELIRIHLDNTPNLERVNTKY